MDIFAACTQGLDMYEGLTVRSNGCSLKLLFIQILQDFIIMVSGLHVTRMWMSV